MKTTSSAIRRLPADSLTFLDLARAGACIAVSSGVSTAASFSVPFNRQQKKRVSQAKPWVSLRSWAILPSWITNLLFRSHRSFRFQDHRPQGRRSHHSRTSLWQSDLGCRASQRKRLYFHTLSGGYAAFFSCSWAPRPCLPCLTCRWYPGALSSGTTAKQVHIAAIGSPASPGVTYYATSSPMPTGNGEVALGAAATAITSPGYPAAARPTGRKGSERGTRTVTSNRPCHSRNRRPLWHHRRRLGPASTSRGSHGVAAPPSAAFAWTTRMVTDRRFAHCVVTASTNSACKMVQDGPLLFGTCHGKGLGG
ncbi:hypothetical protein MRX96_001277 [Rhipicephalus microplus]